MTPELRELIEKLMRYAHIYAVHMCEEGSKGEEEAFTVIREAQAQLKDDE